MITITKDEWIERATQQYLRREVYWEAGLATLDQCRELAIEQYEAAGEGALTDQPEEDVDSELSYWEA